MPAQITERKIEEKVVRLCRQMGLYCRKFSSPSNRGVPDRIIGKNGRILFLELKRPGNEPTALQLREINLIRNCGLRAVWVDNFRDAEIVIRSIFEEDAIG